jgi:hypothetical protein
MASDKNKLVDTWYILEIYSEIHIIILNLINPCNPENICEHSVVQGFNYGGLDE